MGLDGRPLQSGPAGPFELAVNLMRTRCSATISDLRQAIDSLPRKTRVAMLEGVRANEIIVGSYAADDGGICPMLAAHREGARTRFSSFADAWDGFAFRGTRQNKSRRASERELLILTTHLEASLLEEQEGPPPDLIAAMADHRDLVAQHDLQGAMEEHRALREDREQRELVEQEELLAQHELEEQRELVAERELLEQRERATQREILAQQRKATSARQRTAAPSAKTAGPREQTARPRQPPAAPRVRPGEPDRSAELREQEGWAWMRPFRRYDEYERALALVRSADDALGEDCERERELVG